MLIQIKIQIEKDIYESIKSAYQELHYKSLSEYIRDAINTKVKEDQKRLREIKRIKAMEMIGKVPYDNFFESIECDDFEKR